MDAEDFDYDDGRTWSATILRVPGVHKTHKIRYRPLSNPARAVALDASRRMDADDANVMLCKLLAGQIREWTLRKLVDETWVPMPITWENCLVLKPILQNRLFAIVLWGNPGDVDPEDPDIVNATPDWGANMGQAQQLTWVVFLVSFGD
ncbi:MAG: hypothetical protein ABL921_35770 [Pirellula sp.]